MLRENWAGKEYNCLWSSTSPNVRNWHMGDAFRRRSESVSFLRVFCRAGETTSMPLDDPLRTSRG
jgi:hypothetical protein